MENENILIMKDLDVRLFTDRGELPVIDRLSLTLKAGETLGIVGESGCGKSMLASAIMGLVAHPGKVTGGSIQFEGQELVGMKKKDLRRIRGTGISMIFQEPMTSLNPIHTVGKQIAESVLLHSKATRKEAMARARQLLELCDQDFVPPLSHRNSTSQTNWAETEEKTDGIAEYLENICSQHVVLWKEEGVVRAFMTWKDHFNCENLEAYPDSCYLTTLCVWPDYRGQGISEVMYAEAEKDIAAKFPGSRITLRTWSTNGAQEHILDKLGYSLVRRLKDDRGEGIDTVYFVKKEENDR